MSEENCEPKGAVETSLDAFLGGRLIIEQSKEGYRAAMDPVLLAAAVPTAKRVLDLGCGVGTALLCYGARVPEASLFGMELDPRAAALALSNAERNEMAQRCRIYTGDLLSPPPEILPGSFDQVFANPPYDRAEETIASPHPDRARSNQEGAASLRDWISALLKAVRPKGGITLIHRADRTDEILRFLYGKAGEIAVIPLWPRAGSVAKRVVIRARKGVKGGAILHPGLVLHGPDPDERYTRAATAILREGGALE